MREIPIWDTQSLYPGLASPELNADQVRLAKSLKHLLKDLKTLSSAQLVVADDFRSLIQQMDTIATLSEQLSSYLYMLYSVNTQDEAVMQALNAHEAALLPWHEAVVRFRSVWGKSSLKLSTLLRQFPALKAYELQLTEDRQLSKHQMSTAEEQLAADLSRAGADAWSRLQSSISSTLTMTWDEKKAVKKTVTELRQFASDPDRSLRHKAYQLELAAWKSVELPVAAALNGVKGQAVVLNRRRGWKSALEVSAHQARLTPAALECLLNVMQERLPLFRRYLKQKARMLKVPVCGFYDLFAPIGHDDAHLTWSQAKSSLLEYFEPFSPEFADFVAQAFDRQWIHARPQAGKVGGAYCTSLPLSRQPRVLCNFDGSFGELKTLAHELGHAWHFWLLKDRSAVWHQYPMTLAETASIFAETLMTEGALRTASPQAAQFILEQSLQDSTQVIVDILSRFQFEKAVFERREHQELSARELCQLMEQAQKDTYGEALNPAELHPWMWAVKGHYYSADLGYYNYPYAFGQLVALALYGVYKQEGPDFVPVYKNFLVHSGVQTATALAKEAGFNLEDPAFWQQGMAVIEQQVNALERRIG